MKPIIPLLIAGSLLALLASCSSTPDEVREREAAKTQRYADAKEKSKIRKDAREERINLWYESIFDGDDDF